MERDIQFYNNEWKNRPPLGYNSRSNDQEADQMNYDASKHLTESQREEFRREFKRKLSLRCTRTAVSPDLEFKYSLKEKRAKTQELNDLDGRTYCELPPNLPRAGNDGCCSECKRKSSPDDRIKVPPGLDMKYSITQRFALPVSKSRLNICERPSSSSMNAIDGADYQPECQSNWGMSSSATDCRLPQASDCENFGCNWQMPPVIPSNAPAKLSQACGNDYMRTKFAFPISIPDHMCTQSLADRNSDCVHPMPHPIVNHRLQDAAQTYMHDYTHPEQIYNYEQECSMSSKMANDPRPTSSHTHMRDRIRSEPGTTMGNRAHSTSTPYEEPDYRCPTARIANRPRPDSTQTCSYDDVRPGPIEPMKYHTCQAHRTYEYQQSMTTPITSDSRLKSSHTCINDRMRLESGASMGNKAHSRSRADKNYVMSPPTVNHTRPDARQTYKNCYMGTTLARSIRYSHPLPPVDEENDSLRRSSHPNANSPPPVSSETYTFDAAYSGPAPRNTNHARQSLPIYKNDSWRRLSPPITLHSSPTAPYHNIETYPSSPPITNHSRPKSHIKSHAKAKNRPMSGFPTTNTPHILYYRRPDCARPRSPHTIKHCTQSSSPADMSYTHSEASNTKYYKHLKPPRMSTFDIDRPDSPPISDYDDSSSTKHTRGRSHSRKERYLAGLEDHDSDLSLMGVSPSGGRLQTDFESCMDYLKEKYQNRSTKPSNEELHSTNRMKSQSKLHDVIDESLCEMARNVPYLADDLFQRRRKEYKKLIEENKKLYQKQNQKQYHKQSQTPSHGQSHAKKPPNHGGNHSYNNGPHNASTEQSSHFRRAEKPTIGANYTYHSPDTAPDASTSQSAGLTRADLLTFRNDVLGKLGGMTDDFTGTLDEDVLKAKILGPMLEKLQLLYMNNVRGELALLEDLELIPGKVGEVYQCERAIKRKKEENEKKMEQRRMERENREREHREWERRSSYSTS